MKHFAKHFSIGFAATAALMYVTAPTEARAQDRVETPAENRDEVSATVVVGAFAAPDYEGAETYQTLPLVNGEVRWDRRYFSIEGLTARLNVLNSDRFEFGPVANLTMGRDTKVKRLRVRALGTIDDAYEVGGFAAVKFGNVLATGDEVRVQVQALRDVSDVHDGWVYEASAGYRIPVSKRFAVSAETSVRLASDEYADTYFSVTPQGSTASGLSAFTAQGGIKDVGADLTASYAVSDRFSLIGFGGYRRLVGDFGRSPIVRSEGSRDQLFGGIGIGIGF